MGITTLTPKDISLLHTPVHPSNKTLVHLVQRAAQYQRLQHLTNIELGQDIAQFERLYANVTTMADSDPHLIRMDQPRVDHGSPHFHSFFNGHPCTSMPSTSSIGTSFARSMIRHPKVALNMTISARKAASMSENFKQLQSMVFEMKDSLPTDSNEMNMVKWMVPMIMSKKDENRYTVQYLDLPDDTEEEDYFAGSIRYKVLRILYNLTLMRTAMHPGNHENEWRDLSLTKNQVLIIDGLDKCAGSHHQQRIVSILASAMQKHALSLCILIAKRPEPHFKESFADPNLGNICRWIPLNST
ncbi:hypothetical protein GYMLUDRAFT_247541 [Collybiopsis luxurians FD-317 M1]|uniref:Uncharacterized protein n=1 Tax=Collybiopsis luxurians FD-317 M1 TaxID=944289 RepID=A0A0D0BNY7_9AGAR|nr:hypothetical protein GYMLUDRAFT_247541 [Collybiopsis luxurians FD-317 M1]